MSINGLRDANISWKRTSSLSSIKGETLSSVDSKSYNGTDVEIYFFNLVLEEVLDFLKDEELFLERVSLRR